MGLGLMMPAMSATGLRSTESQSRHCSRKYPNPGGGWAASVSLGEGRGAFAEIPVRCRPFLRIQDKTGFRNPRNGKRGWV